MGHICKVLRRKKVVPSPFPSGITERLSVGDLETSSTISDVSSHVLGDCNVPFHPKYIVKVTEPVKNGDILQYTVKTTRHSDGCDFCVSRRYEDFEFLHHSLLTQNATDGIIMPPLPQKPVVDAKEAEQKSKKHLGLMAKTLIGDEFHKDCRSLEKYLRMVIGHEVLGRSSCLDLFLLQEQAPIGVKLKEGIFSKLFNAAEEARKANHVDIEDFFQHARAASNAYSSAVQQSAFAFNEVLNSQQRICLAYAQLSTALKSCITNVEDDDFSFEPNKVLIKFGETIDDAKQGVDVEIMNDGNTLGFWLDLYSRYSVSVKDMLYRRTCLMIEYEESNRLLDKAKPSKRHLAEESKVAAEKAFENCSEVAQRELISYNRQRQRSLQETLCVYADAKIKTARDTFALLAKSLTYFKQAEQLCSKNSAM